MYYDATEYTVTSGKCSSDCHSVIAGWHFAEGTKKQYLFWNMSDHYSIFGWNIHIMFATLFPNTLIARLYLRRLLSGYLETNNGWQKITSAKDVKIYKMRHPIIQGWLGIDR